jgi:hypothetical protein
MGRNDRRRNDPEVQKRREAHLAGVGSSSPIPSGKGGSGTSGGWGVGNTKTQPATGNRPAVNPFMTPKGAGLNIISQTFPSNYYVSWDLSAWRSACDQAVKMGYTMALATMYSWTFESSPFIQSLFRALGSPIGKIPFLFVDEKGKELPEWTDELCNKSWQKELRKEIALAHFWGFSGLNIDPVNGKIYKYPQQDIDPINRLLKASTYSFNDGANFSDHENLLYVQPTTSYEGFLGWLQPITRSFIQMNQVKNNWSAASRRLAFPLMTVGYPQNDGAVDQATGIETNPYKTQAENVIANGDPSKGLVYPYTLDHNGHIVKALNIEFEKTGTNAKAHEIFKDFNEDEKNEIREMILGGTLNSSTAKSGSRALGEVHGDKLETIILDLTEFVETYLNDEYLKKIKKFYKNFPNGKFVANKAKQLSIEDITSLASVLQESGKRFTDSFFEANGLAREFFEDAPVPTGKPFQNDDDEDELSAVIASKSLLGLKKKFL